MIILPHRVVMIKRVDNEKMLLWGCVHTVSVSSHYCRNCGQGKTLCMDGDLALGGTSWGGGRWAVKEGELPPFPLSFPYPFALSMVLSISCHLTRSQPVFHLNISWFHWSSMINDKAKHKRITAFHLIDYCEIIKEIQRGVRILPAPHKVSTPCV